MKMVRWLSATAGTAIVAATFALPAGAAFAATTGNGNTTGVGNVSAGSGNTINAPISAPINLCSVSAGLLGFANSSCEGGASSTVSTGSGGGNNGNVTGVGNASVLSGNTVNAPVSVPVNVCGASVAAAGYANSGCKGGAHSHTTIGSGSGAGAGAGAGAGTGTGAAGGAGSGNGNILGVGNASLASGNTVNAPISAPVNLCSISLGLLGFANSGCLGGATTDVHISSGDPSGNITGVGNAGVLSGNTINAPVSLPVNVCAISAGVAGYANSGCKGGAAVNPPACRDGHCAPNPPACRGSHCAPKPPACTGSHCAPKPPACTGSNCPPPPHHGMPPHKPGMPQSGWPAGTTAVSSGTGPSSGLLPTTGADLLGLAAGAAALIGLGTGTVVLSRRRRQGA
jgi:hypothetical protein